MPACSLPGCVSQVVGTGVLCSVHAAGGGKVCEQCHGTGEFFYSGQQMKANCVGCGGTGYADKKAPAPRSPKGADPVDSRGLIELSED